MKVKSALKSAKGYTLIEMLVVVAILGIIGAIGITLYSSTQVKIRDHKRKEDLKAISKALELYYSQNRSYPASPPGNTESGFGSSDPAPWIPGLVPDYIQALPVDPINQYHGNSDPRTFIYAYISNNPSDYTCPQSPHPWYILGTRLESGNDLESLANRPDLVWCDGVTKIMDIPSIAPGAAYYYVIVHRQG